MSFICDRCNRQQPKGTKPEKVIVETRKKEYPVVYNENIKLSDNGGSGYEIVKEISVCPRCFKKK